MREGLTLLDIPTPDGCTYSGHSLRSCAATSARAIGLVLDAIATLMGMRNKDTTTVTAVSLTPSRPPTTPPGTCTTATWSTGGSGAISACGTYSGPAPTGV